MLALTAPTLAATGGVAFGGAAVSADGSWQAPGAQAPVSVEGGVASLTLAPSSAALVTVSPAG